MELAGVHVPAATPFDPVTGDVDLVAFRANVRAWLEHPIRGVVVAGSTGEAVLLDEAERRSLVRAARDVIPPDRLLIVGTGQESTRATVRLGRDAAEARADALLVMPPAFYRSAMTPEALVRHYENVASAAEIPVIVYQVPLRFGTLDLPAGLVARLSHHENIVGIKDSRGDLGAVGALVEQCADGFEVLVGSGSSLYGSLEVGAVGGILGVANLLPHESAALAHAFSAGDHVRAGDLQRRIGPVHDRVVRDLGIGGVKAGLEVLGLAGGAPRPPLAPLAPDARRRVEEALRPFDRLAG